MESVKSPRIKTEDEEKNMGQWSTLPPYDPSYPGCKQTCKLARNRDSHTVSRQTANADEATDNPTPKQTNYRNAYRNGNPRSDCFTSTVFIERRDRSVKVSKTLFDTGSDFTLIHRGLMQQAGILSDEADRITGRTVDGRLVEYNETVSFGLWISGIRNTITAYVQDNNPNDKLLLGTDSLEAFRCRMNTNKGILKEWRVLVSRDVVGWRRLQFVVKPDPRNGVQSVTIMGREEGIRECESNAQTPLEFDEARRRERYRQL